jgi:hypothetical protein
VFLLMVASIPYDFRIRFNLPERLSLQGDKTELVIVESDGHRIKIKPADGDKKFSEAKRFAIFGEGYKSPDEARIAANRWRYTAEVAFAYMGFGVDFGDRAATKAKVRSRIRRGLRRYSV